MKTILTRNMHQIKRAKYTTLQVLWAYLFVFVVMICIASSELDYAKDSTNGNSDSDGSVKVQKELTCNEGNCNEKIYKRSQESSFDARTVRTGAKNVSVGQNENSEDNFKEELDKDGDMLGHDVTGVMTSTEKLVSQVKIKETTLPPSPQAKPAQNARRYLFTYIDVNIEKIL